MTKARCWPNNAAWARDCAAEEAARAVRALRPLIDGEQFTREEVLRREAIALAASQTILRLLAEVGARVRPGV